MFRLRTGRCRLGRKKPLFHRPKQQQQLEVAKVSSGGICVTGQEILVNCCGVPTPKVAMGSSGNICVTGKDTLV